MLLSFYRSFSLITPLVSRGPMADRKLSSRCASVTFVMSLISIEIQILAVDPRRPTASPPPQLTGHLPFLFCAARRVDESAAVIIELNHSSPHRRGRGEICGSKSDRSMKERTCSFPTPSSSSSSSSSLLPPPCLPLTSSI